MNSQKPVRQPVVGSLRPLLMVVAVLAGLLAANSLYLGAITLTEQFLQRNLQDYFYLLMFLAHLLLGLLLLLPFLLFGYLHLRRAWSRPNRYAVRLGLVLYLVSILVLFSGLVLTRFDFFEVDQAQLRLVAYWLHVLTPLAALWLFFLHRLAATPVRTGVAMRYALLVLGVTGILFGLQQWSRDPAPGMTATLPPQAHYLPALARSGPKPEIPAAHLMGDASCAECHQDVEDSFAYSMHRFSSFNNPAYRFSIDEARQEVLARDGNLDAARLCAVCHDPVLLFSGRFDQVRHDFDEDPAGSAGITCISCHAISAINSVRGNGDYTLEDPLRYPFAHSRQPFLKALNRQLIKAKPELHKRTFLKPLHKSAEFCSTCHKVHMPKTVNHYRWLRGQDHYDSFLQSGVSGHRVDSFYYPPKAKKACADCHMPLQASDDPAARDFDASGQRKLHNHQFAAANTGVSHLLNLPDEALQAQQRRLRDIVRVDIFGLREQGHDNLPLQAPLRHGQALLQPGKTYLLEVVIRTTGVGHHLTQGTADSNQLWLDLTVRDANGAIGRSGGRDDRGRVDPWSYFVNAYVLDKNGQRIDRRNALDTFVALYDHQIPPGAASTVHYQLRIPDNVQGPVSIDVALQYRKFDNTFMEYLQGEAFQANALPVTTLASSHLQLALADSPQATLSPDPQASPIPQWVRWNDYGIGLLRQGKNALRQAEAAFQQVEALGRGDGAMNLVRAYFREGRLQEAAQALQRAGSGDQPAPVWTRAWYSALLDRENGRLDRAIDTLQAIAETRFEAARQRGFDFGVDTRVLKLLGRSLYERARQERGGSHARRRRELLSESVRWLEQAERIDPEDAATHYNLSLSHDELGDTELAAHHHQLHQQYRPDDHAREQAASLHRASNPAANHAADAVAVYDLQRPGAFDYPQALPLARSGPLQRNIP